MVKILRIYTLIALTTFSADLATAQKTTALWLFDEPQGLYPSHVMDDQSENDYPLVIGPGGMIVEGLFGNALEPIAQPPVILPEGEAGFGLAPLPVPEGRTIEPLNWMNANFCAFMTSGENHLRKEVGLPEVTQTKLNLGNFDWTVEFWYKSSNRSDTQGVVFEIGQGPRGENDLITSLSLNQAGDGFILYNAPAKRKIEISSDPSALEPQEARWHHFTFVYVSDRRILNHFVDGSLISTIPDVLLEALAEGEEDYMSIGRNGRWGNPLPGCIDELRFSEGVVYQDFFTPPESFAWPYNDVNKTVDLVKGPPLLFDKTVKTHNAINLGSRKHLFIDDAFIERMENITFVVNPPRKAERVIENIEGPFRKHLTIIEDEDGVIRLYNSIHDDFLAVRRSKDGINWENPDLGRGSYRGQKNIVLQEMVGGLGNPFIDPNGPPETRWKYISGYHRRGIYVYTSPDGYTWTRHKTSILPFRSGTQSCSFYDDQRQMYVGYHRTGIFSTPAGATCRGSVVTETKDLYHPIQFKPMTQEEYLHAADSLRLRQPLPWYLDNGPLTPGGFGLEFPHSFDPEEMDPVGVDFYVTKAIKYPWAPDTYFAFPIAYFHYEADGPVTRQILMDPERMRGSGPIETQISVSRDGLNWKRYPRPAYVGNGLHQGWPVNQAYLAQGMVKRGDEIWQYYFGTEIYHSSYQRDESRRAVYRLVQRLDGFISADAPYDRYGTIITKPFIFKGSRLMLNIDTDALGYTQVGFLDERGQPIPGFSVDDCIYINGDFIATEVEWIKNTAEFRGVSATTEEELVSMADKVRSDTDVSELAGRIVRLVFRMRGTKLYALQFTSKNE